MMFRVSHIPNAICILRIGLIAPIVWCMATGRYGEALLLIVLAGLSDGLDGFLAKHFGWRSRLGGILDPFADKLLLVAAFLTLAWLGVTPVWLTAVVIGRDLVIVAGALAYNYLIGQLQPEPTKISKLNTGLQLLYILSVLSREAAAFPGDLVVMLIGAAVLVTSVVSGLDYCLTWGGRARAARA